ncbi:MAG: hypothetical protein KDC76_12715 [Bacteroidetes bacterium]|nr:hypothetical protein [Bacteroidota bacterium]
MNSKQIKKLVVLGVFVALLVGASWYLYNLLVKTSPYYPQSTPEQEEVQHD